MHLATNHNTMTDSPLGSIEAGGTNFNCAIGHGNGTTLETQTFPTTSPSETYEKVLQFFEQHKNKYGPIQALGIAHFGPLELNENSAHYGKILTTAKPGWAWTDACGYFQEALQVPIAFQTDVNGAAIGEHHFGAARNIRNFVYVTVGTGIGVSVFINGKLAQGSAPPEIGHMEVPQKWALDTYEGCCAFHSNCLEGLASGPAIERRWGLAGQDLPNDHPAWALQASYLAGLCANLRYFYAPEKIIFGGGVMRRDILIPAIRTLCKAHINGYLPEPTAGYENFIVATPLNGLAALKGGLVMAGEALEPNKEPTENCNVVPVVNTCPAAE